MHPTLNWSVWAFFHVWDKPRKIRIYVRLAKRSCCIITLNKLAFIFFYSRQKISFSTYSNWSLKSRKATEICIRADKHISVRIRLVIQTKHYLNSLPGSSTTSNFQCYSSEYRWQTKLCTRLNREMIWYL